MSDKLDLTYIQPYGIWQVTTSGDCEGRTTKQLGIYEGDIHEIALHLADQANYCLSFKRIEIINGSELPPTGTAVDVELSSESGLWPKKAEEVVNIMNNVLQNKPGRPPKRKIFVTKPTWSGSFRISVEDENTKKKITINKKKPENLTREELEFLLENKS